MIRRSTLATTMAVLLASAVLRADPMVVRRVVPVLQLRPSGVVERTISASTPIARISTASSMTTLARDGVVVSFVSRAEERKQETVEAPTVGERLVALEGDPTDEGEWIEIVDDAGFQEWDADGALLPPNNNEQSLRSALSGIFPAIVDSARESEALRAIYSWFSFIQSAADAKKRAVDADVPKVEEEEVEAPNHALVIPGMLDNSLRDSLMEARGRSSGKKVSIFDLLFQPAIVLVIGTGIVMALIIFRS
ncbi:MAG: hypothetical protein ACYTGZ_06595 [Planctomycetota bacterium]